MILGYVYNACHQSPTTSAYLEVTEYRSAAAGASLSLSPNPAGDYVDITVTFNPNEREPTSYAMEIINSSSSMVKSSVIGGSYNRVDIQDLRTGMYIVRIRYGNTLLSESLIVD